MAPSKSWSALVIVLGVASGSGCVDLDWAPPPEAVDGAAPASEQGVVDPAPGDTSDADAAPGRPDDMESPPPRDMALPPPEDMEPPIDVGPPLPQGAVRCQGAGRGGPSGSEAPCNGCPAGVVVPAGFVCVPAGVFWMGSPPGEVGRNIRHRGPEDIERRHEVRIARPFLMAQFETTTDEWQRYTGNATAYFYSSPLLPGPLPVESVNWYEAIAYANARSRAEGLEPCYEAEGPTAGDLAGLGAGCSCQWVDCDPPGARTHTECEVGTFRYERVSWRGPECEGYRLPTEAEWEYAARAGTGTAFWWGDNGVEARTSPPVGLLALCWGTDPVAGAPCPEDRVLDDKAVYCCQEHAVPLALGHTRAVGGRLANPWGLFDMHGNVAEWAWDQYDNEYGGLVGAIDPRVDGVGGSRIVRGGSFYHTPTDLRAAFRWSQPPERRDFNTGVRLVRTVAVP